MGVNKTQLAADLLGVGGGGTLEKLSITTTFDTKRPARGRSKPLVALFNPSEINISRGVSYEQKKVANANTGFFDIVQKLISVQAATLSVDLFFDTYEARGDVGSWKRAAASALTSGTSLATGDATDVTELTKEFTQLAAPDTEQHEPPICHLTWGRFDVFTGVLSHIDQRYTMFLEDGTPVRATLSCTFVEYRTDAHAKASELHSADVHKSHVVRRGDTLQSIAAEQYNDPARWRVVARANAIADPRRLTPGTVLLIPKLRP